ncbi:MAG: hypothetical protein U5K27_11365 [Desulfotignum sp.]|nr:hypothetical protein [Desulfotignum sp.]
METFDSSVEPLFTGIPEDDSDEEGDKDYPGESIGETIELIG